MYRPHNLIPKWLNVCVYKCTYVLEFPGMGKAFFSAKSFQRALLPCAPHWCPCLQSVSSFAWGMRSCVCLSFNASFIFWSPCSLTDLGETKACPGSWDLVEGCLTVHKYLMLFPWEEIYPCLWLAVSDSVSRKHVCYFWYRSFPSQSMVVLLPCMHVINICWRKVNQRKKA